MRHSPTTSILISLLIVACGGSVQGTNDAGNNNNNDDAAVQPDVATVVVDAGPDVDNGAPSSTYPAFKIDAPQVVNSSNGPVLKAPKVVPVYFANDDTTFTAQITSFLDKLPGSAYWGPGEKEYGVTGALTVTTPIQLTENAPASIDDSAIQTWLSGKITSKDPAWPQPDANTIYMMFYPSGTSITLGQSGASCSSFGGYHNDVTVTSSDVAYAVVPRCGNFGGLTGVDSVTSPASHELVEAATDPYPQTQQAFGQVDDNHVLWEYVLGGGEVGDMCAQFGTSFYAPTDLGFTVQRTWSNAAATAGHDPCVPADGTPYFNSMPVLTDKVSLLNGQVVTQGVHIPVGQSATIEVDLFSDAPVGPWTVSASDTASMQGGTPTLSFTWDRTSGQNGEKLHLTIQATATSQYGGAGFLIRSKTSTRHTSWFGLVGN